MTNILLSDDSRGFIECLRELEYNINLNENEKTLEIYGGVSENKNKITRINVRSAGTAARFLTAMLAAYNTGEYIIDASKQMRSRPMKVLTDALVNLGCNIEFLENPGSLPYKLTSRGLSGGEIIIDPKQSSQFTSALLMTGCLHKNNLIIKTSGKETSKTYIDITLKMMKDFGVNVNTPEDGVYIVNYGQKYKPGLYNIEPDISGACYFYAAAAITGGSVLVRDVYYSSMQGDIKFLEVLEGMGCETKETDEGIIFKGPENGRCKGVEVDMNGFSDQAMTLAAIAPFASSPVIIKNIGHIKYQESDRIGAILTELTKLGIKCEELPDIEGIKIYPGNFNNSDIKLIETYEDHRMAMAFALIGLRVKNIRIANPSCVSKTFEDYFGVFEGIY